MKVAVIQLSATEDKARNLARAVAFVRRAIGRKARFIVLPEIFAFRGQVRKAGGPRQVAEVIPGESLKPLMALARRYKVFILAGSVYERAGNTSKAYNTSVLIDDRGAITARYRKTHLFEAVLGKKSIREADSFVAGRKTAIAAVGNFKVGLSICYDLRFPEMYRHYARRGVDVVCVPSAFTHETGKAHWEILLRARAIENRCYVLAPNQTGKSARGIRHYGHSMIVGPWGEILAQASADKEEIIYAHLDMKEIRAARRKLPALKNERFLYGRASRD